MRPSFECFGTQEKNTHKGEAMKHEQEHRRQQTQSTKQFADKSRYAESKTLQELITQQYEILAELDLLLSANRSCSKTDSREQAEVLRRRAEQVDVRIEGRSRQLQILERREP